MLKLDFAARSRLLAPRALSWLGVAILFAARSADAQVSVGGSASGAVATPPPPPPPAATAPPASAPAVEAAPVAATPAAEETPEQERLWDDRDRKLNESTTLTGGVGLLHTQHAQSFAPGQFSVGFTTEYFSSGFLCTSNFPCAKPGGGGTITSDSLDHIGGTLTLTASITKWLEGYAGTSAYANSDASNRPSLLQVLGDTDFGLKVYAPIGKVLHVGGAAELWLINGTGAVGLDGSGTSGKFRGIVTADLRGTEKHTPLRFSINATYSVDNTSDVIASTEAARNTMITRIERFGLGVNRVDHFDIGLGAEAFLAQERIRPFAEYTIMVPVNRQNYLCSTKASFNVSGDNCLANDALAPSKLTLGSRFLPWKRGFAVTAAFDIGITGQNDFIAEMSPIPPWTLYIGAGWAIDTWDRPVKVEHVVVEKEVATAAPEGHIKGYVHETGKPETGVPGAIVSFSNHPEITSLAASPDGHFATLALPAGDYELAVKADGYKDGACSAKLIEASAEPPPVNPTDAPAPPPATPPAAPKKVVADVSVTCTLESLPKLGRVIGHVRDAETRAAIGGASLKLVDSSGHEYTQTADGNGSFHFDSMPPAAYTLTVTAESYMNDVEPIEVKVRQDTPAEVVLMHQPKNPLVAVTQKEIVIKQQVQFAVDSAVILPESTALLTEIADVLERNPRIHKVEIQGHTDSDGNDDHNQILSEDRANSVRTWLVSHGVPSDRLVSKGYGEKKPLVPNVTGPNRQKNRRVQFIILDQDPAAPKPAGAGKTGDKGGGEKPKMGF